MRDPKLRKWESNWVAPEAGGGGQRKSFRLLKKWMGGGKDLVGDLAWEGKRAGRGKKD